jgi:hypothetical protein
VFEVSGDVDDNLQSIRTFRSIFEKDKDLFLSAISLNPIVLALLITTCAHYVLGFFSKQSLADIASNFGNGGFIFNYLTVLWVGPVIFISYGIRALISGWIGRAIFLWDSGEARYKNKRLLLLFPIYTVPLAVITKLISNIIYP